MFFRNLKVVRSCFHVEIDPAKLQKMNVMPFFALYKQGVNLTLQRQYDVANKKFMQSLNEIQQNSQQSKDYYLMVLKKILQNQLLTNKFWEAEQTIYKIIKAKKKYNKNPIVVYENYETLIKLLMKFNIQKGIKLGKALTSQKQIEKLPISIQKNIRLIMGNGYLMLDNYPDAKKKFSEVLQMSPNHNVKGIAQNNLGLACWWHKNPINKIGFTADVVNYEESRINRDFKQTKQILMNSLASFQSIQQLPQQRANALQQVLNQKFKDRNYNFSSVESTKTIYNLIQYYIYNDPIQRNLIMGWMNILLKTSSQLRQDELIDQITAKSSVLNNDLATVKTLLPTLIKKYQQKPNKQIQYLKMEMLLNKTDQKQVEQLQTKIRSIQERILKIDPYYNKRKYILQPKIDFV